MGKLNGALTYLAGPIDYAKDDGIGWRQMMTRTLRDVGVKVLDPTNKLWGGPQEVGPAKHRVTEMKRAGRFQEVVEIMRRVRHEDLRCVDISDFLVVFVDPSVHTCGTYNELFEAERQKKPTLVMINGGKIIAPNWLFDVIPLDYMFDDFESLVRRIHELDAGTYPMDSRWVMVRDHL
jgi:nucleoside 2-deoxyribosyltransferase